MRTSPFPDQSVQISQGHATLNDGGLRDEERIQFRSASQGMKDGIQVWVWVPSIVGTYRHRCSVGQSKLVWNVAATAPKADMELSRLVIESPQFEGYGPSGTRDFEALASQLGPVLSYPWPQKHAARAFDKLPRAHELPDVRLRNARTFDFHRANRASMQSQKVSEPFIHPLILAESTGPR